MKSKILMLGKPGGNLARTYEWHIEALNGDKENRFKVEDIYQIQSQSSDNIDIGKYDIFWFYAKAFHPDVYMQIKNNRSDAKIICGPNILLDKPDIGLSDNWDMWYYQNCRPDVHLDQVEFYSEHVKKFLPPEIKTVAATLDKCMKIDDTHYNKNDTKQYDCLIYSKKRRYDHKFKFFRNNLLELLEKNNISYIEIKAGTFGSYIREDYFKALNKSRVTINLSLDECPGILNYESMFFNVPVIGSPHSVPVNCSSNLYVKDTDYMTSEYLVRKDDAGEKYINKIKEVLSKDLSKLKAREFIKEHTSFERYCDKVYSLVSAL